MASSHKTEHYGLSQFAPLDRPAWLVDYNTDMEKIDTALHNLDETGGGGGTLDQTARDMAQAAQDAAKDAQEMATAAQATADEALEKAEEALNQQGAISGDITNINEEITQIKNDVSTAEEALELAQGCVKKSGDTMTGVLKLAGNPVDNADAANKGYVDSVVKGEIPEDMPEDLASLVPSGFKFLTEVNASGSVDTGISNFANIVNELLFVAKISGQGKFIDDSAGHGFITVNTTIPVTSVCCLVPTSFKSIGPTVSYAYAHMIDTSEQTYSIMMANGSTLSVNWTGVNVQGKVYCYWR